MSKTERRLTGLAAWHAPVALLSVVGALIATSIPPAFAQPQVTIKIGAVTARDPLHQYMDEYKKRIEERSGGRIEARVFPASQLGDINRMIEGVQLGTIEMVVSATGFYKVLHNGFQIGDVPGIFENAAHARRVFQDRELRQKFLSLGEPRGALGIGLWVYGPITYVSAKPMRTLADFKGKKIRTLASKVESDIAAKLEATGVPMPLSEALPALQNGVVDGARGALLVFAGFKYFTVAKYLTALDDSMIPVITILSREAHRRMPADLAKMVLDVARELDNWGERNAEVADVDAERVWREGGGEIIRFSPAEQAELRRRLATIGADILGTAADTKEIWTLLQDALQRQR